MYIYIYIHIKEWEVSPSPKGERSELRGPGEIRDPGV